MLPQSHLYVARECAKKIYGHGITEEEITKIYAGALAPDILKFIRSPFTSNDLTIGPLEKHINFAGILLMEARGNKDPFFSLGLISHAICDRLVPFYKEKERMSKIDGWGDELLGLYDILRPLNTETKNLEPAKKIESYAAKGAIELWVMEKAPEITEFFLGLEGGLVKQLLPYSEDESEIRVGKVVKRWYNGLENYSSSSDINRILMNRLHLEGIEREKATEEGPKWMETIKNDGKTVQDILNKAIQYVIQNRGLR